MVRGLRICVSVLVIASNTHTVLLNRIKYSKNIYLKKKNVIASIWILFQYTADI